MSYKVKHRTKVAKKTKTTDKPWIDKAVMITAFVEPLIGLPQVIQIFTTKSAADISLSSWVGYQFVTVLWLIYGIKHKEKPIIWYQGLWLVVQTLVIIGILKYGDVSTLWDFGFR